MTFGSLRHVTWPYLPKEPMFELLRERTLP
jgi:hypothetical protein